MCQAIVGMLSLSVAVMGNMSKRRKICGCFMLDGQIRGSVNNHILFMLFIWRWLPSSTMPVICPTVNQALKQAPLLSCPTCGVQREARSSLYTLWCGIIWDGEGEKKQKNTLNLFYHHVALSAGLANVFAFMLGVCFLLLCIASDPDDPLTRLPFFFFFLVI